MEIKTDFIFFLLYAIKLVLYNFICLDDILPINNSAEVTIQRTATITIDAITGLIRRMDESL